MEVKCFEIRDVMTFMPVICVRPVPTNEAQRYLLRRDGYKGDITETCIIYIDPQCRGVSEGRRGVSYDPYNWGSRHTQKVAHGYIEQHWHELKDGDVIDVEYIMGITKEPKFSERITATL